MIDRCSLIEGPPPSCGSNFRLYLQSIGTCDTRLGSTGHEGWSVALRSADLLSWLTSFLLKGSTMGEHDPTLMEAAEAQREILSIIRARRLRETILGTELFSDPAWDMLLALFLAELRQQRVTTTELMKATSASRTTALRWIDALEQDRLIRRRRAPLDARKCFVELSQRGSAALREWVRAVGAGDRPARG